MTLSPARVSATDLATLDAMEQDALDAIEAVQNPDEAEALLTRVKAVQAAVMIARLGAEREKRWGTVRLRAERRVGELLGPAEHGGDRRSDQVSAAHLKPADRTAAKVARQVAAVPEEVFESFVETAQTPTRARLLRVAREAEAEAKRAEPIEPVTETAEATILHGGFADVLPTQDLTDAVVISDPPYPREFLDLWGGMARTTHEAGCRQLVVMSGQALLPEVMAQLQDSGWVYRWTGAYMTPGPATRVWHSNVGTKWKPILVYDRGGDRPFLTRDTFESSGDDKRHHYWGQNEQGFAQLVEAFTEPGDLVVDPFLGGGTTALVCRDLGRRFIGCDVDAAAVTTSRERLGV